MSKKFYRLTELVEILGISRSLVFNLIHDGEIPHVRMGEKSLLIPASFVENLEKSALGNTPKEDIKKEEVKLPGITKSYAKHPFTGKTVMILRGEEGYYEVDPYLEDMDPDKLNMELGVTKEQAKAMYVGSMFGWDCPGAKIEDEPEKEEV